ncbi:MAG: DEAD/DEAH box helicase, partial [Clostridia bacterium]|nr:DEAD/DEAH box helicase [Clostridia bacterium]
QGLGKTKQIVDTTRILKEQGVIKRCLIICCINGNKYNWRDEIGIHSDEKGWILGTRRNKKGREFIGSNEDKLYDLDHLPEDYFYIITNLETLRYKKGIKTTLRSGRTKTVYEYPIVDKLVEMINSGELTYIAIDEVHKAANPTSQQGKALVALKDAGESVIVPMTGTPIRNKPLDVYLPLYLVGKEDHSFYSFKNHYCQLGGMGGSQVLGYKNMGELQEILDECMLRRRKNEVLDLPEKIYVTEYVEMTKKQTQLYEEVLNGIRQNVDLIRLSPDPLAQLLRLRQVTGNPAIISSIITDSPKYDRMEEMIAEHVEEGGKAIVFSNWTSVINPAYERLRIGGFNPALYTGENTKVRDEEKNRFQNDENCKVICGTIGAMGTGLTLTAADLVIFLDEPWTRANKDQAEDRAHRIGTTKSVRIVTLVCPGTIDEKINSLVYRKGKTSDILVDKEADLKITPNVLNFLLN